MYRTLNHKKAARLKRCSDSVIRTSDGARMRANGVGGGGRRGAREKERREKERRGGRGACTGSWFEVGGPQVARTDNTRRLPRTESLAASASVSAKIFSHFPPLLSQCCFLPLLVSPFVRRVASRRVVLSGWSIHAARYTHTGPLFRSYHLLSILDHLLFPLFSLPPSLFLFLTRLVSRYWPPPLSSLVNRVLLPPSFLFIPLLPTYSTSRMYRERRAFAALEWVQIRVRRNTNCSDRRSHIFSTAPEACRGRRSTRNEIVTRRPPGRRARDRKGD